MKTNRILQSLFALCLLFISFPASAHAEDWAYTGYYPYIYLSSSNEWIYLPNSSPLVYDYSTGGWAENPLGGRSFDIRKTFAAGPLSLSLTPSDGSYHIYMTFDWSGIDYAHFEERVSEETTPYDASVYYRYAVNEKNGTCVLHGDFLGNSGDSFTIVMNFNNKDSGTFTMIGTFPYLSYKANDINNIGTIEGTFSIGQIIVN